MRGILCAALVCLAGNAWGAGLNEAILRGDVAAVRAEIAAGTDLEQSARGVRFPPLALAAARGEGAIVDALLGAGADPNGLAYGGLTPLAVAVRSCRAEAGVIRALIAAGADIDGRSGAGLTPVHAAIQAGRTDLAVLLLELGADVDAVNTYGDGVLNYAIYYENTEIVQAAMGRQVDTDQLNVLFTTERYYQIGFGTEGLAARRAVCGS